MAMDAGKFNFKNIGGANVPPKTQSKPATGGPKESPSVQQEPSESVQLGPQTVADTKTDKVATGEAQAKTEAPQFNLSSGSSSIPSQIGDFLIAGPSAGKTNKPSFSGLTALTSLGATSLEGLNGGVIASVNPLKPKSATRVPTTSVGAHGIGDTHFVTTSGRVIR